MPCGGQATFKGSEVFIECDGDWDCCQREQAQAKCNNYNDNCPLDPQGVLSNAVKSLKGTHCKDEWAAMQNDMNADKKAGAQKWATSPCMADKLEKEWTATTDRTTLDINMDHQVEVKLGGLAKAPLKALDRTVNQKFGSKAKEVGNNIGTNITAVYLLCPNNPPCSPPPKPQDFSAAPKGKTAPSTLPNTGWVKPQRGAPGAIFRLESWCNALD